MLANWVKEEHDDQTLLYTELAISFIRAHQSEKEVFAFVRKVLPKAQNRGPLDHILTCIVNRFEDKILYYDSEQHPQLVHHKLGAIILSGFKYQDETLLRDYVSFLLEKFSSMYINHARKYQMSQMSVYDIGIESHPPVMPRQVRQSIGKFFIKGFAQREAPVKKKLIPQINYLFEQFGIPSQYQLKVVDSPEKTQRLH